MPLTFTTEIKKLYAMESDNTFYGHRKKTTKHYVRSNNTKIRCALIKVECTVYMNAMLITCEYYVN